MEDMEATRLSGFKKEDLHVKKKGGASGRGRRPKQRMEQDHFERARAKFSEKIRNKKSAGTTAFELEARRDPWDKKLLRDLRDFPRLLVHSMFHKQLKADKKACVVTLFLYLEAPAGLVAQLEEVAAKSRRSQAARKTFEELVDYVYRDTSKEGNTFFVEVYSKFKKKNV